MRSQVKSGKLPGLRFSAPRAHPARREIETFESLLGALSTAMARVPAIEVDREIDKWLGRICLALNLDRSTMFQRDSPGRPIYASHTWLRPGLAGASRIPLDLDPEREFPKMAAWVIAGNNFVFSDRTQIPPELRVSEENSDRYLPRAIAALPMWAGDRVMGAVTFGRFRSPRHWRPELIERLGLVLRIFSSAIERKQSALESQKVQSELALAHRKSMMGQMVASLAHEINQPLAAILSNLGGLSRLLAHGPKDSALALRVLDNAIDDTKRAAEIVRRVHSMFKAGETLKNSLDLPALVNEVLELVSSQAALREISVSFKVARRLPRVVGDRVLLQQCLLNLIFNAFDSVVKGQRKGRIVTIEAGLEKPGWIAVKVTDNGPGVDSTIEGRLFEPFLTTKPDGMGLGLLVTRSIIEAHGGKIRSDTKAGGGATFIFTLPADTRRRKALAAAEGLSAT